MRKRENKRLPSWNLFLFTLKMAHHRDQVKDLQELTQLQRQQGCVSQLPFPHCPWQCVCVCVCHFTIDLLDPGLPASHSIFCVCLGVTLEPDCGDPMFCLWFDWILQSQWHFLFQGSHSQLNADRLTSSSLCPHLLFCFVLLFFRHLCRVLWLTLCRRQKWKSPRTKELGLWLLPTVFAQIEKAIGHWMKEAAFLQRTGCNERVNDILECCKLGVSTRKCGVLSSYLRQGCSEQMIECW